MKKILPILLLSCVLIFGCSSDYKTKDGKVFGTYGLLNKDEVKNENVQYKVCVGNIIWSCLLFHTVIGPVYFIGFDYMEPVGLKDPSK